MSPEDRTRLEEFRQFRKEVPERGSGIERVFARGHRCGQRQASSIPDLLWPEWQPLYPTFS
jgi:hypothetical protein